MQYATSIVSRVTATSLLAIVYFLTAKLALGMSEDGYASPFWPPSGISIAVLLLGGYRLLPGVFLGAFFVNWQVDQLSLIAFQIAVGNSLEAFLASWLINRFISRRYFLNYFRHVMFFLLYVTLAAAVGATIGAHAVTDWRTDTAVSQYMHIWNVWWLGDLVGTLVFTPLVLAFGRRYRTPVRSWNEKLFFIALVGVTGAVVFGGWFHIHLDNAPFAFLPLPILVAVAYRFTHKGCALTVLFLALMAINGTLADYGPFVSENISRSLLLQQVYVCCIAVCGMLLCPVIYERSRAQQALQRFSNLLEARVGTATNELRIKNSTLREKQQQQQELIDELLTSERRYRALFDNAPEAVVLFSLNSGKFVDANDNALMLFGYSREQIMSMSVADLSPEKQAGGALSSELAMSYIERAERGEHFCFEWLHQNAKGGELHCEVRLVHFPSREDRLVRGSVTNIEDRLRAEERRRLTAKLFENTSEAVIITNDKQRIIEVNDAFCRVSGYSVHEVVGQPQKEFVFGPEKENVYEDIWHSVNAGGRWQGEIWGRRKNGELYPKWLTVSEVKSSDDTVTHYLGQFTDITDSKAKEERLLELATYDHLTGLLNRNSFLQHLEQSISDAERSGAEFAVLFIDLDGFKRINDSLGHDLGDRLLCAVAERLKDSIRANDLVARLGGDEFTLLVKEPQAGIDQARLAEKVISVLAEPYLLGDNTIHLTASAGISRFPMDSTDSKELLSNADMAMYRAKSFGRNSYQFFTADMKAQIQRQLNLETELRSALNRKEFVLHYQPQVDLNTGLLIGVEALIRWQHPLKGLQFPGYFIDVAEQSGLICDIGDWALHEACRQAKRWHVQNNIVVPVAVNLSARQFQNSSRLLAQVESALSESDLSSLMLELEITESMLMENVEEALETLVALRRTGIAIAIDDFGTGYSSLAYLKQFAADKLKVDRTFVRDLEHDPDDAAIVRATIALAHSLGLKVIAEGVENDAQKNYLIGAGCDQMQGFLIAKALPPEELIKFVHQYWGHDKGRGEHLRDTLEV